MGKNWKAREKKHRKAKTGMVIRGRSLNTLQEIVNVKGEEARKKEKEK